jgi:hypothetical protein
LRRQAEKSAKEGTAMKKLGLLNFLMALFLISCATVSKTPVPPGSLKPAELQGTWEGQRTMSFDRFVFKDIVVLEVQPGGPPFRGTMTIYSSPRWDPGQIIRTYSFDRGQISAEGNLLLPMEQEIIVNLRLFREENDFVLEGDFLFKTNKGALSLRKK